MPIIKLKPFPTIRKRPSYGEQRRGLLRLGTKIGKRDIRLGAKTINVFPGQDIQKAIDTLNKDDGGRVLLLNGTHKPLTDLVLYSNIYLEGQNAETAIIDFNSTAKQIKIVGSNAYSAGTVAINNGSTTVTGTSTTFTSAMVGRKIMLGGLWYDISAFGSTTSLTISAPFGGVDLSGASYVVATVISDARLINILVKGSNLAAIKIQYGHELRMDWVDIQTSATGLNVDDTSQLAVNEMDSVANNSGMNLKNVHYSAFDIVGYLDTLAGNAITLDTVTNCAFNNNFILDASADGFNIKDSSNITINGNSVIECTGQGIEFVSGNSDIIIDQSAIENNGSDGIKFTGTSDNCMVMGSSIKDNGGYGVNIAASDCDNNIITSCNFSGNTSGAVNDSGTGTQIRGNVGIADGGDSAAGDYANGWSALPAKNNLGTTYGKLWEFRIPRDGAYRFDWQAQVNVGTGTFRIYRDGTGVGTELTTTSTSYVNMTDDITGWKEGELAQFYAKNSANNRSYILYPRVASDTSDYAPPLSSDFDV